MPEGVSTLRRVAVLATALGTVSDLTKASYAALGTCRSGAADDVADVCRHPPVGGITGVIVDLLLSRVTKEEPRLVLTHVDTTPYVPLGVWAPPSAEFG